MNCSILGAYRGKNIYVVPLKDFFNEFSEEMRMTQSHMWMIMEDNMLIYGGKVIGQVNKNKSGVNHLAPISYKTMYGNYIRNYVEPKSKPEVEQKQEKVEKRDEPEVRPITERVTVEKLFKQGRDRLQKFVHEAEDKYFNCGDISTKRLIDLYNDGLTLVGKYKKREGA